VVSLPIPPEHTPVWTVIVVVTVWLAIVAVSVRLPVVAEDDALSVTGTVPEDEVVPEAGVTVTPLPETVRPPNVVLVVPVPENWSVWAEVMPFAWTQDGVIVTVGGTAAAQTGSAVVSVAPPTTAWSVRAEFAAAGGAVTEAVNWPDAFVGVLGAPTVTAGLFTPMTARLETAALETGLPDASRTRKVTVCAVPLGVTQLGDVMLRLDGPPLQLDAKATFATFEFTEPEVAVYVTVCAVVFTAVNVATPEAFVVAKVGETTELPGPWPIVTTAPLTALPELSRATTESVGEDVPLLTTQVGVAERVSADTELPPEQTPDWTVNEVEIVWLAIVAVSVRVPVVADGAALRVTENAPVEEVVPEVGETPTLLPETEMPETAALVVLAPEKVSVCEVVVPLFCTQVGVIITVGVVGGGGVPAQIERVVVSEVPPTTAWRSRVVLAAPDGAVTDAVNWPDVFVGVLGVPIVTTGLFAPMIARLDTAEDATGLPDASRTRKVTACAVPFAVTHDGVAMLSVEGAAPVQLDANCTFVVFDVTVPAEATKETVCAVVFEARNVARPEAFVTALAAG